MTLGVRLFAIHDLGFKGNKRWLEDRVQYCPKAGAQSLSPSAEQNPKGRPLGFVQMAAL